MKNKELNWLFDYTNLKIYQYQEGFKFSLDSILLAEYADIKKNDQKIIDLCTGNAVVAMVLNYKYQKKIVGVEIQKEIAELARESIAVNQMENDITILESNVKDLKNYFPGNNFDVVLSNPPYFKFHNQKYVNINEVKSIARHEIHITLEEIIAEASFLLKEKGRFYLVHIPERLDEIVLYSKKYNLALKQMQLIYSDIHKEPVIVLATLVKNGKNGCKIGPVISIDGLSTYQNLFRKNDE